jgi:very-short-patch-repair endonuclease
VKQKKTTTTTPTFSQKSKFEKELDYLQNENILEKVKQRAQIQLGDYVDQLKKEVKKLETEIDGKQNKPLSCFTEEDRINCHFDIK